MSKSPQFQFRKRYNLPPTDPRFLDATFEEIAIDGLAHYFHAKPEAESFETEDFAAQVAALEAEGDFEDVTDDKH